MKKRCHCGHLYTAGHPHPECTRATNRVRNAQPNRKRHRTAQHQKIRTYVLNRDHHTCHACQGPATECDYIIPLAHGGLMTTTNAKAACKTCNSRRGATIRTKPVF